MLEWLKNILGDGYTEEIDKQVSDEISKAYAPRADLDSANEAKAAAEASHIIQAALVSGALNMLFHQFYGLVAGGNVNTGSSVALGITFLHGRLSSFNHYSLPFQQ